MNILNLKILTIIKLLYVLRALIIGMILGIFGFLILVIKFNDTSDLPLWIVGIAAIFLGRNLFNFLKRVIISRAKYPLPLNLLCNILELGKPYYLEKINLTWIK